MGALDSQTDAGEIWVRYIRVVVLISGHPPAPAWRQHAHQAIHMQAGGVNERSPWQVLLRKHKKQSLLLLLVAAVGGSLAVLMGGIGLVHFVHAVQVGEALGLRPICEVVPLDR